MPELPEVEVIRRELCSLAVGDTMVNAEINFSGSVGFPPVQDFRRHIKNLVIKDLSRKGKFLIFHLGGSFLLVVHLRMTGNLTYVSDNQKPSGQKHLHIVLFLRSGAALYFSDPRKFGRLWLLKPGEEHIAGLDRLGPDWLYGVTAGQFKKRLAARGNSRIKTLLLDQRFMAGLGNIYADESLKRAGIHPAVRAGSLKQTDPERLFRAIQKTLAEGIKYGGTSFRDYLNASGKPGGFQKRLLVYGRKGEHCEQCGSVIERIVMGGRGTYYCPGCQ